MPIDTDEIEFVPTRGHWEVYVNGEFFCSADSYIEALATVYAEAVD